MTLYKHLHLYSHGRQFYWRKQITQRKPPSSHFFLQTTDGVQSLSLLDGTDRVISRIISRQLRLWKKNTRAKKCRVVLYRPIVLIYNVIWGIIITINERKEWSKQKQNHRYMCKIYKWGTQIYHKRYDVNFPIVNFPFICSNIPAAPAYGVYISQLIQFSRACGSYNDLLERGFLLTRLLLC